MVIEVAKLRWITKEVRLKLLQLKVWYEPGVIDVHGKCLFKGLNTFVGQVPQFFGLRQTRKLSMDAVQVNHRCKEYISAFLLLDKPKDVIFHRQVLAASTSMNFSFFLGVSNEHWRMQIYSQVSEVQFEQGIGKRLLGFSLGEQIEARHQCGPPPMTFFSQTSPRLYSSSQDSSFAGSSREKSDSLPFRFTTTTSSGAKWSMKELDCVLIITCV